ncbi:hypothetical protein [Enterococcus sp. AZ109]|uniref:hypothetical protein n=1 Tax=Enterococcus sp. AZ109 TaxID=2774634 RepID=UPI003F1FBC5A
MTRTYQFHEYKKGNILSYLKCGDQSTLCACNQVVIYYSSEKKEPLDLTLVAVPQDKTHRIFIFVDNYLSYAVFDGTKNYYIDLKRFVFSNEKVDRPTYLQKGVHQIQAAQFSNDNPNTGKLLSITTENYIIKDSGQKPYQHL